MKVRANGIGLNAVIDGPAGAPWVTLLTGIANDHGLWEGQLELAGRYRLLRLDTRGHGTSESSPAPYALSTLAADVAGAWDALGIERSCVAGLGLGGVVAAELAIAHPQRVSALVPVSCRAKLTSEYRAIWPSMVELANRAGMEAVAQPTLERWFAEEFRGAHPSTISSLRRAIVGTSLDGYLGCIAALLTLDWADRLPFFRMPVLYVSGELDRVGAPPAVMQAMSEATPGSRHVVLPGATHISVVCNPRAFSQALVELLIATS